jgi:hypothetical protein
MQDREPRRCLCRVRVQRTPGRVLGRPRAGEPREADAVAELLVSDSECPRTTCPRTRRGASPHGCGRSNRRALRLQAPGPCPGGPTRGHRMRSPSRCRSDLRRHLRGTCRSSSRRRAHKGATPRFRPAPAPRPSLPGPRRLPSERPPRRAPSAGRRASLHTPCRTTTTVHRSSTSRDGWPRPRPRDRAA